MVEVEVSSMAARVRLARCTAQLVPMAMPFDWSQRWLGKEGEEM